MATLHHLIREHTRPAHQQLETELGLVTAPSHVTYRSFLSSMAQLHVPVEAHLQASQDYRRWVSDHALRLRAERCLRDLAHLGVPPPPAAVQLPPMDSLAEMLGVAYVFEGATLGGIHIRRALLHALELPDQATTYVAGYGRANGTMWRRFVAALDGVPLAESERQAAMVASDRTFQLLGAAFSVHRETLEGVRERSNDSTAGRSEQL